MILARVEITNYKQYGGHHVIDIPQSGAIGVIGANGVGKTTLFEAIEWALYSPSSIKAADVRPRTWRGKTEVKVTLDDPATGNQYTVERELGKASAKASIYRVGTSGIEEKILDGASQVTQYVTHHLIGLDHPAFVATFFTRQKELGFFNGSPTARRRDVGKLLGLETIREAQQIIAESRKRAVGDARSYREQSEASLKDRDFNAEIGAAEQSITSAKSALKSAIASVTEASATTASAETSLQRIEQIREQDAAIAQKILHRERERAVASEQASNAASNLARLDIMATEREKLLPEVATIAVLEEQDSAHNRNRQSELRKRELLQHRSALEQRDADAATQIRDAISGAPAPDANASWNAENPEAALDWAAGIDISALEYHANTTTAIIENNAQLEAESQRLTAYLQRVEQLNEIVAGLLEQGDPSERVQQIQTRLQELNGSNSASNTTAARLRTELQKNERMLANLRTQHEGEICPTCQRPFTSDETAHAIVVFEREADRYREELGAIDSLLAANRKETESLQTELGGLQQSIAKLAETRASIESGNRYVQEQQEKVEASKNQLQHILQSAGLSTVPTIQQRDQEQQALIAWRKVVDATNLVGRALRTRQQIAVDRQPIDQEILSLTDANYDEPIHKRVIEQLQSARQAKQTIARIDIELARRSEIESARSAAISLIEQSQKDLETWQQERRALGFDAQVHQQAQAQLRSAQIQEREATEHRHRADVALRETEHVLARVTAEKDRIGKLALEAEARQRQADDLDQMYREFTEFERYAAAWYAPRLSEIASELVSQVTDGKYDKIEFDNNFSIQVFDGDDEKFPYETFSGGERDAIALCARIALSRVIGGASASPPGFLVLDEVFGSLDLERRQRLLEMLAAITGADDHFRQVFIISHVDDVRTSPMLDDIWRVVETDDGLSELHALGVGEDIGEL